MRSTINWIKNRSRVSLTAAGLVLVIAIGILDHVTRPELTFGFFYLIPVVLVATAAGRTRGIVIAVFATVTWFIADLLNPGAKPSTLIMLGNALNILGVFFVSALLASAVSAHNKELGHGIERRTAELQQEIEHRKSTEAKLRASDECFRQLAESIPQVFWMTDLSKTHMLYISPAYEAIWGRTCASLYASPASWLDTIHPDDREKIKLLAITNRVSNQYDQEYRIVRPDGSIRWIHDRAFSISDDTGRIYRIAGIAEDITERKLTEIKLATLAHAVEGTGELICITDLQDRFIFVNRAFQTAHGYTEAEILGRTPEILYSSRNPPSLVAEVLKHTRLGGWQGEVLDRRKDGTEFSVRLSTSLVKDRTGQVIGLMGVAQDITERKLAEIKVATLAHAVESTGELICITDLQDRFIFANRAFQNAYGYTEVELLGKTPGILFSPHNPPSLVGEILEHTRLGGWRGEVLDRRKDGTEFPIRLSTSLVKDRTGQVIGLIGVAQDITERKQVEEALQRQKTELKVLFDLIPAMIWFKDTENGILRVNKRAAETAGKSAEEIEGKSTFEIYPEQAAKYYADDLEVIRSGTSKLGIVETLRDREGKELWIQTDKVPYCDKDGRVVGIVVLAQDITERKLAEHALRESQQRLLGILDNTTAVIYLKDRAGRYILANREFETLFHINREQLVGKTDFDLFTREQAAAYHQNDLQALAASAPLEFEEVMPHDGDPHTYISIKFPLFDTHGVPYGVCGISTDITERKRLEKEILEISDREQARIGHDLHGDLCQRLVSIAFASNLLEKRLHEKSLVEAAEASAIAHLLDESITQARTLARVLFPVKLESEGLASALQELTASVNHRFAIQCEVDCPRPTPIGDIAVATHLYRIAQEAVSNAVRHAQASHIVVGLQMLHGQITLSVTDNGVGLGDNVRQGRGMGLHTMHYRARMIDGQLEIKRVESGGTRVACRVHVRPS